MYFYFFTNLSTLAYGNYRQQQMILKVSDYLYYSPSYYIKSFNILIMVLERTLKQYKHLMRTLTTQLIQHQKIITTNAKAKHLRTRANKLFTFSRKAARGKTSPLNLLQGRVTTEKAHKKLLLELVPRLKKKKGNEVLVSRILYRRRGDNAPMVAVSIRGNQKDQYQKQRKEEMLEKGLIPDRKKFWKKILMEEKDHLQRKAQQNPGIAQSLKKNIDRVEHEQWTLNKSKKEPPKYTYL